MVRSFRYQLSPTKKQERLLLRWLDLTRELYNAALEERRGAWTKQRRRTKVFDQIRQLPAIREARPEFVGVPSVMQRGVLRRIDLAFADFFRRCKNKETPGYPRFRSAKRWHSLSIDDLERAKAGKLFVAGGSRVAVPILGKLKIKMHRPLEGKPKTMRIIYDCGRWYARFACIDIEPKPLPVTGQEAGVDLGLTNFAATDDGTIFANPRPLRQAQAGLARALRRVHKRKKGSRRRRDAVRWLARRHARVANIRRDNHITVSNALVAKYDTIFVEALTIQGLVGGPLAKHVRDAAWGNFLHWLRAKAERAGREVVEVNPRGTSQTCPRCGVVAKKLLSQRAHSCACGLVCDRDVAAAQVILKLGRSLRRDAALVEAHRRPAEVESVASTSATGDTKTAARPT